MVYELLLQTIILHWKQQKSRVSRLDYLKLQKFLNSQTKLLTLRIQNSLKVVKLQFVKTLKSANCDMVEFCLYNLDLGLAGKMTN